MPFHIEVLVPGGADGAVVGEGPVWDADAGVLHWVDIEQRHSHRFDPATGTDTVAVHDGPIGALVPGVASQPTIAAIGRHVVLLTDAGPRPVAELPSGDRANDGKCDPAGRFLIGTLTARRVPGACALYRVDGPNQVAVVVGDVTVSNGLDWSPDGTTMYFVDTPTRRVDAFDYDVATGTVSRRRPFVDLADAPGRPDGLTVDGEGGVWVAVIRGGEIRRYTPDGRLDVVVPMPASRVTSCCFGGPDLADLYVTSGRFDLDATQLASEPHAGALFRLRPGFTGKPPYRWRGFF